jgi:hypothetical protein
LIDVIAYCADETIKLCFEISTQFRFRRSQGVEVVYDAKQEYRRQA